MTVDDIWISVNDRLPKKFDRVLVICHNYQNHNDKHVTISEFWGVNRETGRHMWSKNRLVSYWAPLPEMPKEPDKSKHVMMHMNGIIR